MSTQETIERKRGGCLTAFLVLMFALSPLCGFSYLSMPLSPAEVVELLPYEWPLWFMLLMGLLAWANLVFAIAIWKWKRWGVYGLACVAVVFFVANMVRGGISILGGLLGLAIAIGILRAVINPVWNRLE